MTQLPSESYMLNLTFGQIRVLHLALEKYIRNHDVILNNSRFDIKELRRIFADLSRGCELYKTLNDILIKYDSKTYKGE
jgi:hypothetical protein